LATGWLNVFIGIWVYGKVSDYQLNILYLKYANGLKFYRTEAFLSRSLAQDNSIGSGSPSAGAGGLERTVSEGGLLMEASESSFSRPTSSLSQSVRLFQFFSYFAIFSKNFSKTPAWN
jgi:hypothetical protein